MKYFSMKQNKSKPSILLILILLISILMFSQDCFAISSNEIWIPESANEANNLDLLADGHAIVIPSQSKDQSNLYELEKFAYGKNLGLWSSKKYKIKNAGNIINYTNSFQIVEGVIINTKLQKNNLYINFGDDWKTDFTISIPKQKLSLFKKQSLNPQDWSGKRVQVRGWVEKQNGAMIKVSIPEQILLLDSND